jgi:hydrogenase maturation protein HypF
VEVIQRMLQSGLNSPFTTSAGRLFDAVAALLGLRQRATFEGQAAMELEFRVQQGVSEAYSFGIHRRAPLVVDWEPMMRQMLLDLAAGENNGVIAAKFHHSLAEIIGVVAEAAGEGSVVLTGGCFQNKYLAERTIQRLRKAGFRVYWHQQVPPNDGGIALGQIAAAAWAMGNAPRELPLSPGRRHGQQPETCNH